MHIGLSITPFGHHPGARRADRSAEAIDFTHLAAQVAKAQAGRLDFVLLADRFGLRPVDDLSPEAVPFEPTTLAAALATVARQIGMIATAATNQHEPYNLARRFASLDTISKGRTGWNLVASSESSQRDTEYVNVVTGLWDSWEDDAFIYDKTAGRFFVPEKMHVLNHKGEHFTVRGPLNVNRSPQGKPVISHRLTAHTLDIAAKFAEVIFIAPRSLDEARALVTDFMQRLERHGRERRGVRILADVIPYVGNTKSDAEQLRRELDSLVLDEERPMGFALFGTPGEIADSLQEWAMTGNVDGFTIQPPLVPESLDAFVDLVIPELRARRVFRSSYDGQTLRDHLGLPAPEHPAGRAAGPSR